MGVARGSSKGRVLLLGADYDTSTEQSPLEDNGAGVAAMLEVARNYMLETGPEGSHRRVNTVVFVAFDLNTKEYVSSVTIPRFLIPKFYPNLYAFLSHLYNKALSSSYLSKIKFKFTVTIDCSF